MNELSARFPNLTVVDVGAAVRQAQGIMDQVIAAVQVVFMFALGAGLLVLYSALVATEDERRREAAVMRVYGASRSQVTGSQRVEFLAMGCWRACSPRSVPRPSASCCAARIRARPAAQRRAVDCGPARGAAAALAQRLAVGAQGAVRLAGAHAEGLGLESGMAEAVLAVVALGVLGGGLWFVLHLQKTLEEKHRQMLGDLHDGLTKQGDRLGGQLTELREAIAVKLDARLDQISNRVSERLDEGFKKTNETFVSVMQRLATIDEAQKKIDSLTGSVVSLQELLGDKKSRGAFGEVQLEALVRNAMPSNAFEMQYTLSSGVRVDCALRLPPPTGLVCVIRSFRWKTTTACSKAVTPNARWRKSCFAVTCASTWTRSPRNTSSRTRPRTAR
jgi:hypothetical protein